MKKHIRAFVSLLCAAALALGCASCGGAAQSTGKSGGTAGVTHITVWNYYNGDQLESFNKLVDQFNETPIQFAADGYDCVYAIYAALPYYAENNGGLDVTDMPYSDLSEILISVFTDSNFSHDGLTGAGMTWTTSGEVNKDPKVNVNKDGAYAVAE